MTDKEFIEYLWKLLWDDLSDGDTPSNEDWDILRKELSARNINIEDLA